MADVQSITRGGDAPGVRSRARQSLLSRQVGVDANPGDAGRPTLYDGRRHRFSVFLSGGKSSGSYTQLYVEVSDLEQVVKDLKARGVKFEEYDTPMVKTVAGIANVGGSKAAWLKDSEGNLIGIGPPVSVAAQPRA